MKRYLMVLLLVVAMVLGGTTSVFAAPPNEESWSAGSFANGAATFGYFINTTNLQVSAIWIQNDADKPVWFHLDMDGVTQWQINSAPHSGYTELPVSGLKFYRTPLNDPEDPNHIRYPNGLSIGARYG